MKKQTKMLVQQVPAQFVVGTFLCHLEGTQTRFMHATRAVAVVGKHTVTVGNLQARAPEFQATNFICMEWDRGPVTIPYCKVFAKGVTHELRESVQLVFTFCAAPRTPFTHSIGLSLNMCPIAWLMTFLLALASLSVVGDLGEAMEA